MKRVPVNSSDIRSIGYYLWSLEIEFNSGGIYQYSNVPESVYQQLISATSHGRYFHAYIKDKYPTRKIN